MKRPRCFAMLSGLLPLLLTACYTYAPADPDRLSNGTGVQIHLREGAASTGDLVAAGVMVRGAGAVNGTLVQVDEDRLFVHVPVDSRQIGLSQTTIGQDLVIDRSDIIGVERRQLDRTRTALMVGAALAASGGILNAIMRDAQRPSVPGDIDDPDEARLPFTDGIRVPLFSIPIRP